ncbi:bifunctional folylpolyglutamate synthase/dihydrofolate synthase [Ihubacter massiliensis]|uniref:tetrahydrofolate synthase n=1 Tax=Hominibacterium faecale TaxID=2839743 RepID=A0A9J6QZJ0_9FIRM|nr:MULTISPECIES: folylpolyglutamate synthase/dihydrofolate synthase family protein [Eubacteriales Family XIII. Incertae Sedis]MCO7122299.1 bifunctional folylpolyglutamate synthase/dihydrofolate synthase [Ihubacter massiliensis]MCU7380866.1 bifunctional folylpolyglutamate synthase/dihydrofolate synthase [Hominibacterium faecale]
MDAIKKIHQFDRFGSVLGLERMNVLLKKLGDPHKPLRVIHVAGTNGKGSVCKFIYEALAANGYKVGLYTSPFIQSFHERIQLDGAFISDRELDQYTDQVMEKAEEMVREGLDSPTEFEVVTAIAFLYFAGRKADFVILEVGLGGSGDSTNVVENPLISIITSISYDHMDRLGNTLEEIAGEKAGIIKTGVPVVSNVEQKQAARVIAKRAYEKGAVLYDAAKLTYGIREQSLSGYAFDIEIYGTDYSGVRIGMAGRHQIENAKTALTALEILRKKGIIKVSRDKLYQGLLCARQPGRFEVLDGDPCVVLDGAHNQAGAAALKETVKACFPQRRIVVVTGMLADKETDQITDELCQITDQFVVTEPDNPRKMPAEDLRQLLDKKGAVCKVASNAKEAYRMAAEAPFDPEVVLIAGSLYLIGEIRGLFN